ncbi:hypothetical protein [Pseudoteredinibacter isoporae]|uniref:Tryptophan 2-monooxygenase n=1 Tax=Pseudoteredinibacter isoporae TaxID=570281 RepID=A0A7X0MX25_9GAMM|nr:hypothetical protein [Pseudoteredinibacter isoporae]MBB6523038.1 tryptophan 2-monooxygenase [Pseudoteredinibacter isoporae]NHO88559.1 hypothetical protein [Pseudoteredinibacter isoporae]NIB22750.1 hypothetical protein [Pseudoteredinibacter isoporae]
MTHGIRTLGRNKSEKQLSATSRSFATQKTRYPDSPLGDYAGIFQHGLFNTLDTIKGELDIGVVGRGAGALGVMMFLAELADKNPELALNVYNFYYDPTVEKGDASYDEKFGRIYSHNGRGKNEENIYREIGCMRFPSIATCTWNMANKAFPEDIDQPLSVFPNPGDVASQFCWRDIDFKYDNSGSPNPDYALVNEFVVNVIQSLSEDVRSNDGNNWGAFGSSLGNAPLLYSLVDVERLGINPGQWNAQLFQELLIPGGGPYSALPEGALFHEGNIITALEYAEINYANSPEISKPEAFSQSIKLAWEKYVSDHDIALNVLIESTIRTIVEADQDRYPQSISYYLELFGRYGFGSGGFRPLNAVSFLEIARLLVWNYADEYLLPNATGDSTTGNCDLGIRLMALITRSRLNYIPKPSCEVLLLGALEDGESSNLLYYKDHTSPDKRIEHQIVDSAFICTAHHSAQEVFEPFSANAVIPKGTTLNKLDGAELADDIHLPFSGFKNPEYSIINALKSVHMMRSGKYFSSISQKAWQDLAPTVNGEQIKQIVHDSDCAATYILDGVDSKNVLLSYVWGDEGSNGGYHFMAEGQAQPGLSDDSGEIIARLRKSVDRVDDSNEQWWFASLIADENLDGNNGYAYNWSMDQARGGFKLDYPKEHHLVSLLYDNYRLQDSTVAYKVYFAGCSYSHLGGWLEGAFMTAINSVAGFAKQQYGEDCLTKPGLSLFPKQ